MRNLFVCLFINTKNNSIILELWASIIPCFSTVFILKDQSRVPATKLQNFNLVMSSRHKVNSSQNDSVLLMNHDYNHISNGKHSLQIDDSNRIQKEPHDDKSSAQSQQISLNINDRSTRLILWSIIILIVSIAEINFTLSMRIYYRTYKKQFNLSTDPNPYGGTKYYDLLSVISNIFLLIASTLILLGFHRKTIPIIITSTMFTIGAVFHLIHDIWGMYPRSIIFPIFPPYFQPQTSLHSNLSIIRHHLSIFGNIHKYMFQITKHTQNRSSFILHR